MKKIITVLIALSLILSLSVTGFAWAVRAPRGEKAESVKTADDVFFEDFSNYEEGGLPSTISLKYSDPSSAEVTEYETLSGKKNVLKLVDNHSESGGVTATLPVPEHTKPITLEIRMKHKATSTPGYGLVMDFTDAAGNRAFRLIRFSNENASYTFVNSGGNKPITTGANHDDIWYTVKLRIDPQRKHVGIIISSEELRTATLSVSKYANVHPVQEDGYVLAYSLPWFNEFTSDAITKVSMSTYGSTCGEYFFDYIKFTNNVPEDKFLPIRTRAESKDIESIKDPSARLVPGIVNLSFKEEIKYLANPIILKGGRSLIDAEEFAALYSMEFSQDENGYKISGEKGEFSFAVDAYQFNFNGQSITTDSSPFIDDGIVYIPIKSFVTALGDAVSWQDNPQCVIIK